MSICKSEIRPPVVYMGKVNIIRVCINSATAHTGYLARNISCVGSVYPVGDIMICIKRPHVGKGTTIFGGDIILLRQQDSSGREVDLRVAPRLDNTRIRGICTLGIVVTHPSPAGIDNPFQTPALMSISHSPIVNIA